MRRVTILANSALAGRLFLKTPFFDLLKKDKNNYIKVFTTSGSLAKTVQGDNVRVFSIKKWFLLNKLGLKREKLIPLIYKLKGVFDSDIILFAEWASPEAYAILKEAKSRKICTLFVQEGSINPTDVYPIDLYPDKLAVWGQVARDLYIEKDIDPARIVITGQPRFDWYQKFKLPDSAVNSPKKMLFASQALWKEPQAYPDAEKNIIETAKIISKTARELNIELYCKLHPSDKRELYKGIIDDDKILSDTGVSKNKQAKWFCSTGYDPDISDLKNLAELISSYDIIVTILSTIGLEAMILKKPTIFFDIAGYHKSSKLNTELKKQAHFAFVDNEADFKKLAGLYIEKPQAHSLEAEKVLYNFIYKNDGNASERIINVVEDLLT